LSRVTHAAIIVPWNLRSPPALEYVLVWSVVMMFVVVVFVVLVIFVVSMLPDIAPVLFA
jgi:hypothetical protein